MVRYLLCKQIVAGSNPAASTYAHMVELADTTRLGRVAPSGLGVRLSLWVLMRW